MRKQVDKRIPFNVLASNNRNSRVPNLYRVYRENPAFFGFAFISS